MELLPVQLRAIRYEAEGISTFEFRSTGAQPLPPFTAGAHIDLHLASGLVRSYSLCNSQDESDRYVVGVNRDRNSRGGSRLMHDTLKVGTVLNISAPRNNFPLDETAPHSMLIGGGIGITPMLCMLRRLESLGRPWTLHYCARNRASAAFVDELTALQAGSKVGTLHLHFDDESNGQFLSLQKVVAEAPAGAHFYCCGPLPMLAAYEEATRDLPPGRMHVEYFSAKEAPSTSGGFVVELANSGKTIEVPEGKTILDMLLDAGVDVPYSCMEGVCASCETRVIEGVPDHRDLVLTKEEQASNKVMMVCCSGSKSPKLVLDL
ncbi:MAG: oxidoreductase [Burkholderiales bacterium]|nr:oxidoreductase [Burkholderiales bacterium]